MNHRRLFLLGLAAAGVPLLAGCAAAPRPAPVAPPPPQGSPQPVLPQPGFHRFRLGGFDVLALNDGVSRRPLAEGFVRDVPLAEVQAVLALQGLPGSYLDVPATAFVLLLGERRVLLDAGHGEFGAPGTGRLLDNLRAAGLRPEDIDTVLISHYHPDHINGLRRRDGSLAFPRAQLWVPEPEHAHWLDERQRRAARDERSQALFATAERVFAALPAERLRRFNPGDELLPGLRSSAAHGHTPGHTVFELSQGAYGFAYMGDLCHVPALFARNPDWAVQFDMDPDAARRVRRRLLDRAADSQALVGGFHFPFPALGHFERSGGGYAFQPLV